MVLILLGIILVALYYLVTMIFDSNLNVKPVLDDFSATTMYMTFQTFDRNQTFTFNSLGGGNQVVVILTLIVDFFYNSIISFFELFNLISAISVYEITRRLDPIFRSVNGADVRVSPKWNSFAV
jgi:hypothetical protein